jgi:hypothetical protein
MEFQFAVKALRKKIVPVVCGSGDDGWRSTAVGLLLHDDEPFDLTNNVHGGVDSLLTRVTAVLDGTTVAAPSPRASMSINAAAAAAVPVPSAPPPPPSSSGSFAGADVAGRAPPPSYSTLQAPEVGSRVLAFHRTNAWFSARVVAFDRSLLQYTVDWDDGDPTGREVSLEHIALDVVPSTDEVGVGTQVVFPQGTYVGTAGNNAGGTFWYLGVVTAVLHGSSSSGGGGKGTMIRGVHKVIPTHPRRAYAYEWTLPVEQLRLSPNAFAALAAQS